MRKVVTLLATGFLFAGCHAGVVSPEIPQQPRIQSVDTTELGGLPADKAVHATVELAQPKAFVLTPQAQPFVAALNRTVEPQRQLYARQLLADPTVVAGIAAWERSSPTAQLRLITRVAAIGGTVMGCQVPPIVENQRAPERAGTMAFFQPAPNSVGQIVLYPREVATGGKYLAIATVIHELRHAAQFQLATSRSAATKPDGLVLGTAYAASWQAMATMGGEADLSYGDYAHLNVEFDAFQTGNEVATLISGGAYDGMGCGFVDTQYRGVTALPALKLLSMMQQLPSAALASTVNVAQFKAEQVYGAKMNFARHSLAAFRQVPMPKP